MHAAKEGKKSTVVSVKSSKPAKRKEGATTAEEVYKEAFGEKPRKKQKKSKR